MTQAADNRGERSEHTGRRPIWIALILASGILLSQVFACVTPFAALATLAALNLRGRDALMTIGVVWLANQAIGYTVLGYPWTWDSAAWGLAIGASSGLAALAATGLSANRPAALALSLPFVAAFATFEFGLYAAAWVLPSEEGAFSGLCDRPPVPRERRHPVRP